MSRSTNFRRPLNMDDFSLRQMSNGPGTRNRDQIVDMVCDRLAVLEVDIGNIGTIDIGEGKETVFNTDHLRRRFERARRLMDEIEFLNEEHQFAPKSRCESNWRALI